MSCSSGHPGRVTIPPRELFWGVIDTSKQPPIAFESLRTSERDRRLGFQFEDVLPLPIERLHSVYLPLGHGRYAACGIPRTRIAEHRLSGASSVKPEALPEPLLGLDANIDARDFELLTGEFLPIRIERRNTRVKLEVAALIGVAAVLCSLGLQSRAADARDAEAVVKARTADRYATALGPSPAGSTQSPAARMLSELRLLEQTRTDDGETEDVELAPDPSEQLESLLATWPSSIRPRVEQLTFADENIALTVSLPSESDVEALLSALGTLPGWSMNRSDIQRIPARRDREESFRARITFERVVTNQPGDSV